MWLILPVWRSRCRSHRKVGDEAVVVACLDAFDRCVEYAFAGGDVHGKTPMLCLADKNIIDAPEGPVAKRPHSLYHAFPDQRIGRSERMPCIVRMRALPGVPVAAARTGRTRSACLLRRGRRRNRRPSPPGDCTDPDASPRRARRLCPAGESEPCSWAGRFPLSATHTTVVHFQSRISGISRPSFSMYIRCSISLSLSCCFR